MTHDPRRHPEPGLTARRTITGFSLKEFSQPPDCRLPWHSHEHASICFVASGFYAERAGGRAGICQFTVDHLEASRRFGRDTLARTKGASVRAKIQFAGVESDPAALNADEQMAKANLPNANLCFFEKGTNHSFLSPFDGPHDDKFWLAAAKKQVSEFVTDGTAFTTVGASIERGADRCLTRL